MESALPTRPAVAFTPLGEGPAPQSASERTLQGNEPKGPPALGGSGVTRSWAASGVQLAGQRELPPRSAASPAPSGSSSCGAQLTSLQDAELKGYFLLPLPRSPWGARQEQIQPCARLPPAPERQLLISSLCRRGNGSRGRWPHSSSCSLYVAEPPLKPRAACKFAATSAAWHARDSPPMLTAGPFGV